MRIKEGRNQTECEMLYQEPVGPTRIIEMSAKNESIKEG